jgi:flagellar biosynthesis GTPase FlhF
MAQKTFKAESAIQALQLVQAELGASALVVSMREVPNGPVWNPWKSTAVEIVASIPEKEIAAIQTAVLRQTENQVGLEFIEERPEIEWVSETDQKLSGLRAQSHPRLKLNLASGARKQPAVLSEPAPQLVSSNAIPDDKYVPPTLKGIQQKLMDQGVEPGLIGNLIKLAVDTLSPSTLGDDQKCLEAIVQFLGAELPVQRGSKGYVIGNAVCVIGASGSGKTSSLAKLALYYSETMKKKITWVCADTVRSGAVAEARAYSDAMGFELKLVYVPDDLKNLMVDAEPDDLFLVDTPGYNPCSESQMIELGSLLAELPHRCTYLIVPATTKESDLNQLFASLGIFNLNGVIVTKLDETHSFGSIYNFVRRNLLPLGFFATGRNAARNLEVADPIRLASSLFGREWNK